MTNELSDSEVREIYDRYASVLYHRCLSLMRNEEDARDAVQETFARAIRNADSFRSQSSPLTWMYRISTNYCLNQIRNKRSRQRKLDDHGIEIGGPATTQAAGPSAADHSRIMALLEEMDDETKQCVVYTFFDDCTRQETAELVGLSVPTVRKRINTFLQRARRQFGVATVATILFVLSASLR